MDEALLKRILPHSIEAEKSVIGAMLMDKGAVTAAMDILDKEDFYTSQYAIMFESMVELFNEGKPVDLVVLQDRLKEKNIPPEVAGIDFVRDILVSVPTSANIKAYASIVHEKAVLRRLIRVSENIAADCYAGKESMEYILAEAEKNMFKVLQSRGSTDIKPIEKVAENVLNRIEQASRTKESVTGIPTGFIDLDYKTSGFQPSDLVLIAARPSMGKTAFVLNVVEHVAMKKNMPCMIFSLEMSAEQLVQRMLAMETGIDSQKLRIGNLNDNDWDQLIRGVVQVGSSKIMIDDTPGISITELRSKCRKIKLEKGLDIVIIDYLQLMSGSGKSSENRQQEISEISRNLKALARELKAPVVALSQLSRACETRTDHRPMLSDLRESGAIEQDADIVMFLYREDYYKKDTENINEAEVIIAKQRNGPIGTVKLVWKPETTKFVNIARE
ncbi:replicative DNA helicase [Johnsonella ignava ATCC 51276]|jgi:replicative DNA helicase|uniref:Replicative DNA helicase n=1 Tax=Johnsonella ignava ATCC 51276 TaxID=679200 RepID=G5GIJ4_9FIRM|nr:replicative DNA helicase [Johnsonella ignava]EHI55669.1 replicative DNA helicase [Johnsonella ignava ATCC 51276]